MYLMVNFYTYLGLYLDDLKKTVNLNEFEQYFNTPHQTIKRKLHYFVKKGILVENKKGKFLFYTLNLQNMLVWEYLVLCEKERLLLFLEQSLFKRLYDLLFPFFKESSFLIFGSATDKKKFNDIDLLIISKKKIDLTQFEETYSVKIHLVQTTEKNLTPTFITEIRKKHIILNNHDYFRRVIYDNH